MSGEETNRENSRDETEPPTKKSTTGKKYPFQTVTRRDNSEKINRLESTENVKDAQSGSQNKTDVSKESQIEILPHNVKQSIKRDENLSQMVNESHNYQSDKGSSIKTDTSTSKQDKLPPYETVEILRENKIELVEVAENNEERKKISRKDLSKKEIDEICGDRDGRGGGTHTKTKTPGLDPRFQQQNQTLRCFVMYTDFYRCENILGEGEIACQWFKDVFTSICPLDWIRRWDEAREEGRLGWTKGKTQGKFPGHRYGV